MTLKGEAMEIHSQRDKNVMIEMKKNNIAIKQEFVDKAKAYLDKTKKDLRQAQKELKKIEKMKVQEVNK